MSVTIDQAFTKQFEADVHLAYYVRPFAVNLALLAHQPLSKKLDVVPPVQSLAMGLYLL